MEQNQGEVAQRASTNSAGPARAIHRRIGLPSGRAVIGALLVTLAVVGLFASFRRSQAETGSSYVIVANTVPNGSVIEADDLAVRLLDLGEIGGTTFRSIPDAVGSIAIQTLVPGQLLQEANVVAPTEPGTAVANTVEVSFSVERPRALNGAIQPGEVVDIIATLEADGQTCSLVVAPKAQVTQVRGGTDDGLSSSSGSLTVTVAVADNDALLGLVFAVDEAEITLVRATRSQGAAIEGAFCGDAALDAMASPPDGVVETGLDSAG